jgi:hypothetical protein
VQTEVEGHDTPNATAIPEGAAFSLVQVAPPSVVDTMMGVNPNVPPTAVQSDVEGHETPESREFCRDMEGKV